MAQFVNKFYKKINYKIGWIFLILSIATTTASVFKPTHYDIKIDTIIENFFRIYKGNVSIIIHAFTADQQIIINSDVYTIKNLEVRTMDRNIDITGGYTIDSNLKELAVNLSTNLTIGKQYKISIAFDNIITNEYYGNSFNKNWSIGDNNWITATHTKFHSLSRVIPYIDQAIYKTSIRLQMGTYRYATPVSIAPVEIITPPRFHEPLKYVQFYKTRPINIQHFGFAVTSQFRRERDGCGLYVNEKYSTDFVLDICSRTTVYYTELFNTEIPAHKIDLIGIDNLKETMEIFYGFNLIDDHYLAIRNDSEHFAETSELQRSASIVTQSVLHQWILNATLPEYWNEYWILEGLVQYYHFHALDAIKYKWNTATDNAITQMHSALAQDYFPLSFSLKKNQTKYFTQQNQMLLAKSASIMRMMAHVYSENAFTDRLTWHIVDSPGYIVANFWSEFMDTEFFVDHYLKEWASYEGYPVLNVVTGLNRSMVVFTQNSFVPITGRYFKKKRWTIPISYTTSDVMDFNSTNYKFVLREEDPEKKIEILLPNREFIICNIQQTGYYRVNYDNENWSRIIHFLTKFDHKFQLSALHPINRAQLVDDSFHLSLADTDMSPIPIDIFLKLTAYLKEEYHYLPWMAAIRHYEYILKCFSAHPNDLESYKKVKQHFLEISSNIYDNLFNITHDTELGNNIADFQYNVMEAVCKLDKMICVQRSRRFLTEWRTTHMDYYSNFEVIDNVRGIIYCTAIRNTGDVDDLKFVYNIAMEKLNTKEGNRLVAALGCSQNVTFLKEFWNELGRRANTRDDEIESFNILFRSMAKHIVGVNVIHEILHFYEIREIQLPSFNILLPLIVDLLRVTFYSSKANTIKNLVQLYTTQKDDDNKYMLHDPYHQSLANEVFRNRVGIEVIDWLNHIKYYDRSKL